MRLQEFQDRLKQSLGSSLENATPQNVREFVDSIQQEIWREEHPSSQNVPPGRIEIRETKPLTYESVVQSYFARAINADRDQSFIQIWLLALDLAYSGIAEMHAEKMERLFRIDTAL